MKTNKEILDTFGEIIMQNVHDANVKSLQREINKTISNAETGEEMIEHINMHIKDAFFNTMFQFLNIFEEREDYKLVCEEDGTQVDLNEASGMLKGELYGENGWLAKYSEFKKNSFTQ